MKNARAVTRAALTWLVATVSLLTAGMLVAVPAVAATNTYTATAATSVRTAAAATAAALGELAKGDRVLATGAAAGDWLPIAYAVTTGYIAVAGVSADKSAATEVTTGPAGNKVAAAPVNIRETASLDATIVAILDKATVVKVTGISSGGFTQISYEGKTRWIYTEFLSAATDTTPDVLATFKTTAKLALRVTGALTATNQRTIAKGKKVAGTGTHAGSYSKVVYSGKVGWVITGYLKAAAGTPAKLVLPLRKATRYINAAGVTMRASADAESAAVTTLELATPLRTTGATKNKFSGVIWDGTTRWVPTSYLSKSKPKPAVVTPAPVPIKGGDLGSTSLNKLEPYGKAAVLAVRAQFPQIKTIYGWRSSSAYSSDHPNGRATDNMIPDYKNNKALGDAVAAWVIANAKELHVTYLIWRQRSYRIGRGYWTKMADRGGDTANHMNHVHISFEPS